MPLMFVHAPAGTFSAEERAKVAAELTDLGLECEQLPTTPFVKSTTWIYFNDYPADQVFNGGKQSTTKIVSLLVNVFEGGLDALAKEKLIAGATHILGAHSGASARVRAYVVIRDVPSINWGVFGEPGSLSALRNPPADAAPV